MTNSDSRSDGGSDGRKDTSTAYRRAFWATLVVCVALAVSAAALWLRLRQTPGAANENRAAALPSEPAPAIQTAPSPRDDAAGEGMQPPATEMPLAPVQLSPQRMQSIGVTIGKAAFKSVSEEIRAYGNVQPNERKLAYVQTRFSGWIREVYADAAGDLIRRGQPLFTIYSPEIVATEQEYLLAKSNAAALRQSSIRGVADGADAVLNAARQRLSQWGIPAEEIARLEETGTASPEVTIHSPADGYVMERNALPNAYVQPETKLYALADLSEVWVLAQVFQSDAGKIKPGDRAEVTVDAYPGKLFEGRVDYLLPQLNAETRTLPVRLVFPNPGMLLRPGMYVNVRVTSPRRRELVIPASAAFHSGTRTLAFVYRGEGRIEPRAVELGPQAGDDIVVQKGLKVGEQIVTSANFLIDSEAQLQAAAGSFLPPPPGAGAAAAMNAPAQAQAGIEMTTDPAPPRKGANTVRVRLTTPYGQAIAAADVEAVFFLPAMPAMGMASMKTLVHATDKGGGMYEGTADLGAGGTWQVTITARRNGNTIANRQMTVNATGGM